MYRFDCQVKVSSTSSLARRAEARWLVVDVVLVDVCIFVNMYLEGLPTSQLGSYPERVPSRVTTPL